MLRLEDHWVWDSWVVEDGTDRHLFFLKAARSPEGPSSRHTRAVVGHAVSTDLSTWTDLPDALGPGPAGAWDDLAIWTGSVVRGDDGAWRMFYTAISQRDGLTHQRLGVAVSDDLTTWVRVGDEPLLEVDPRWYATHPDGRGSETWRDPLVLRDPHGDGWHMVLTARAAGAEPGNDGVLAHARSDDLLMWEVGPPLTDPGAGFSQLEVPQVRQVAGRWVLAFTCHPDEQTPAQRAAFGEHCTWSVTADSPLGPWDVARARPLRADPTLFAAPLVQRHDGSWCLIGFHNREAEGVDGMWISDPLAVRLEGEWLVGD